MNHIFSTNVPNRMLIISDFSKDVLTVHVQFKFRDTSVMIRYLNSYLFVSTLLRIVSLYLNKQRTFQTLHSVMIEKKVRTKTSANLIFNASIHRHIQCIVSRFIIFYGSSKSFNVISFFITILRYLTCSEHPIIVVISIILLASADGQYKLSQHKRERKKSLKGKKKLSIMLKYLQQRK